MLQWFGSCADSFLPTPHSELVEESETPVDNSVWMVPLSTLSDSSLRFASLGMRGGGGFWKASILFMRVALVLLLCPNSSTNSSLRLALRAGYSELDSLS